MTEIECNFELLFVASIFLRHMVDFYMLVPFELLTSYSPLSTEELNSSQNVFLNVGDEGWGRKMLR